MNQLRRMAGRLLVHGATILLVAPSCLALTPLVLLCSCNKEPKQADKHTDEEVFGKYAIGPNTATPLDQAVEALNKQMTKHPSHQVWSSEDSERAKAALAPLTVEEVVAVIDNWDRVKKPVADGTYRIYEQIAKTKILPPHSLLELDDQWFERGKQQHRVLRIHLAAMVGKDQGDGFVIREYEFDRRPIWQTRPGYRWLSRPQPRDPVDGWISWFDSLVRVSFDDSDSDALVVTVNRSYDILGLQVVVLDNNEKRYDLDCRALGAYGTFLTEQFRLDYSALPRDKIKYLGIEAVTREDMDIISQLADNRAKGQQIDLLPLPEVGCTYDFSLTAAGKLIESRQLRGKVILIDMWASWCGPCLKKMPELKELYSTWHDKGLEIIGISFDEDPEEAQTVIDRMKLPWPSAILPPRATEVRKLWRDRDQITYLPTVLIIDARGILRFELVGDSGKIEEKVEALLSETTRTTDEVQSR